MKKHFFIGILFIYVISACQPSRSVAPVYSATPLVSTLSESEEATEAVELQIIQLSPTPEVFDLTSQPHSLSPNPMTLTPTVAPSTSLPAQTTPTPEVISGKTIVVDHTSLELFDQIPDNFLAAARNLHMMYADASVGKNISDGLDCLAVPGGNVPSRCRQGPFTDFIPDSTRYDRSNWIFEPLPGGWTDIPKAFIESLAPSYVERADVLSFQFNYAHVGETSDIADRETGFFADNPRKYDIYDLESFWAQYPQITFFLWTTSLSRAFGSQVSEDFNNQVRQYASVHGIALFDVADIEAHDPDGNPCFDNRDGVEYCSQSGKCENYPDDGKDFPAICPVYTTEVDGGHLGSVSAGAIRLAKAFWVFMALIAGWQP